MRQFSTQLDERAKLDIAVAYMGHGRLGDMLIGSRVYSNLERTLGEQAVEGNLLLLGLRGSTARLQQKRLALIQNETLFRPDQGSILFAGTGEDGKIAGQASLAVAMVMPAGSQIHGALSASFTAPEPPDPFASFDEVRYQLPAEPFRFSIRLLNATRDRPASHLTSSQVLNPDSVDSIVFNSAVNPTAGSHSASAAKNVQLGPVRRAILPQCIRAGCE